MRRAFLWRGLCVAAVAVALVGAAWAGEAFEGKISFQVTAKQGGGQPMAIEYAVKKGIIRMEAKIPGMANYTLINPAEKKMTTVMPAQKMVMEMAIPDAKLPEGEVKPPEVTKTDKAEKVTFKADGTTLTLVKAGEDAGAGAKTFDGQQWQLKQEKTTSELWVAKDLTVLNSYLEMFKAMAQGPNAWMKKVEFPGFPYRIVTKDAEGNVQSEFALVSVDTKSPDDALFEIPADFKKLEMPKMPAKE